MSNSKIADKSNYMPEIALLSLLLSIPLGFVYYLYCNRDDTSLPALSVLFGAFLSVFAACTAIRGCRQREALIIAVVFFVKFALTAYQAYNKNLPLGGEDWGTYHTGAAQLALQHSNVFTMFFESTNDLFTNVVAAIYMIFGAHTRQINLYVLASSFVAARYIFKTVALLTDNDYYASVYSMVVFAVWPIDIIYSVTFLREMPIQMLMAASFYGYVKFIKQRKFAYLVSAFMCVAFASMMHSGVLGVLLVYVVFMMLHEWQKPTAIFSAKNFLLSLAIIAVLVVSPFWDALSAKLGDISSVDSLVDRAQQFTEGDASTRYITDMPESGVQFFLQIIPRALMFAVVPLPWMINGLDTAISWVIDAVPQLWIIYRLVNLFKLTKHNKKLRLYTVIAALCVIATYIVCGMGTTAYGNAIRHRTKIFPIIITFIVGVYYHAQKEGGKNHAGNIRHRSGV